MAQNHVIGWDAKAFLAEYKASNSYYTKKNLRIDEFQNTIAIVDQGFYIDEDGNRHDFDKLQKMISDTVFVDRELPSVKGKGCGCETVVEVVNEDCLEVARKLVVDGYAPGLLNMASFSNPGGGVASGAGAQEETVFRRTDLFKSLYQFASYAPQYGLKKSPHQYPLDRNFGGVFTPYVTYFRESEQKGFALMTDPVNFAVITVAGIARPDLTPDGREIAPYLVGTVKNKIRTIFRLGALNGCDSLVLGALGCGAFQNPPAHVAKIFREVIDEPEFAGVFRRITFAILDDANAHRLHNPDGNFLPFLRQFPTP